MRRGQGLAVSVIAGVATLILVEGVASIASWRRPHLSLAYRMYASQRGDGDSMPGRPTGPPSASRDEIEALIPAMRAAGVGMGNVPFPELVTDRSAINAIGPDGCLAPKPGVDKVTTYIRSGDFDRFDPPSVFHDRTASLPEGLQRFIDRYSVCRARFTSNGFGERTTLPAVIAARKILVAGDSVAVGSMIDDADTIASQMQRARSDVAFVNLGVNGATAADVVCRLTKAALQYRGQIAGLVYVYCENDFDPSRPYGTPEQVVNWLRDFAEANEIPHVTVVLAPYIYNIVPSITRFEGSRGALHPTHEAESMRLKAAVADAQFGFVDIGDVARAEAARRGTDFAALSLFVDHNHLSGYGVSLVVAALAEHGGQGSPASSGASPTGSTEGRAESDP